MKFFRFVWLVVFLAGLLFVSAAFASDTTGDCDDTGTSTSLNELPDAALILGQSDDGACRDCHANQELLQELAVEEEPAESLSEGPG